MQTQGKYSEAIRFVVSYRTSADSGERGFVIAEHATEWRDWLVKTGVPSVCVKIEAR